MLYLRAICFESFLFPTKTEGISQIFLHLAPPPSGRYISFFTSLFLCVCVRQWKKIFRIFVHHDCWTSGKGYDIYNQSFKNSGNTSLPWTPKLAPFKDAISNSQNVGEELLICAISPKEITVYYNRFQFLLEEVVCSQNLNNITLELDVCSLVDYRNRTQSLVRGKMQALRRNHVCDAKLIREEIF